MDVGRLRLYCRHLALCLRTFLQLRHLLPLHGRCRDLLAQDDITDLARREGRDVHAVALAEVLLWGGRELENSQQKMTGTNSKNKIF